MSTPSYCCHVFFIKEYKKDDIIIKKNELRSAVRHTDNPGMGMGPVGEPSPYKIWYDIYDTNIEDGYYAPRGTRTIINNIPSEYVEDIWNKKEFLKLQRRLKLERLNK